MKIEEVKKKYKNKWVLAEVLKESELNEPLEVKPIVISDNQDDAYDAISKVPKGKVSAIIYTGKIEGTFLFVCKV